MPQCDVSAPPSPLLGQGGVAAPLIKCREASVAGADGVVGSIHRLAVVEPTTPSAPSKEASRHFYSCRVHPSLAKEGTVSQTVKVGNDGVVIA